jgi:hypothetical protein
VIAALRTSMASGELARGDPEELLLLVWAAAHGLVALHFSGRFGFDERRFRRAYDRTTGLLWERLRRG